MSKKPENTEQKKEKVVTKYDLKMQKRAEERKQAERERQMGRIIGVLAVLAVFCLVISFPIRTYLALNGTYIKVGGEKITKVEFDYNYNIVKNNYITQNGYYLSMFGMDLSGDLSQMMYSGTMTWQDYFEQLAVDSIRNTKALKAQAEAEGFTCDLTAKYADYEETLKKAAAGEGKSEKAYAQELYGSLATMDRVKPFVMDTLFTNAYYDSVSGKKAPSEEKIEAYYQERTEEYDSVDYRLISVNAELPTAPTELADPQEDKSEENTSEENSEETYEPSEAEIEAAMKKAHEEAEEKLEKIATEGELNENVKKSSLNSLLSEWLFAEERKAGDKTIIEYESQNLYYVVAFEKRYRDETPTIDLRVIVLPEGEDGQAVLDQWKNGAATEESFAELADDKNDASVIPMEGGLMEGLTSNGLPEELATWMDDKARVKGDTKVVAPEGNAVYIVYYVGQNQPSWKNSIKTTLVNEKMVEYMAEITQSIPVEDPKGKLNYLKIQAAEQSSQATQSSEATQSSQAEQDNSNVAESSSASAGN